MKRVKEFLVQCKRVWQVTKKPDKEEIKLISKVSAIGIIIIGIIGFLLSLIIELILKAK
uniref:Protein translocase subunit SecE n=1 Tax=Thermodesulfobacterium geofontis TaxID=1295609 RepID=A0A7V4N448_9BACT